MTRIAKIRDYYFMRDGVELLMKEPNRDKWERVVPIPFYYHRKRAIVKQAMTLLEVA